jgi:hypothetical protein
MKTAQIAGSATPITRRAASKTRTIITPPTIRSCSAGSPERRMISPSNIQ